jgi:hypothetical protein
MEGKHPFQLDVPDVFLCGSVSFIHLDLGLSIFEGKPGSFPLLLELTVPNHIHQGLLALARVVLPVSYEDREVVLQDSLGKDSSEQAPFI